MKKLALWTRGIALLLLVSCVSSLWGVGLAPSYVKTRTFQNLAPQPSKFHGHYLAIDENGTPTLANASDKWNSESYWELKYMFWKDRGYITHAIVQRGNNRFNGKYLNLDPKTGKLGFVSEPIPTARWLVRYAGKYQGWDAFHIQNLAENDITDMMFIAIDEATGEVTLTQKPTPGAHWFMNDTPYLPAETGFYNP
jgi:hypothetical protein